MENYNNIQYATPKTSLFSGTVIVSVLIALLAFGALAAGALFLYNKAKNAENAPQLSNEEIEAQKAANALNVLANGFSKKPKEQPSAEEVKEEIPVTEPVAQYEETVAASVTIVDEDFNDTYATFIQTKHPQLLAQNNQL